MSDIATASATMDHSRRYRSPDLVLGNVVSARGDPVLDALHGKVFRDHQHVQHGRVAVGARVADQVDFGRVREHGLRDERPARLDECGPRRGGDACRVIGVGGRVVGPPLPGDLVGVDEHASGQQAREGEVDERGLAGAVGSDDQVKPLQGRFTTASSTADVPSGRYSTILPASSRATVVMPRSASTRP